MFMHHHYADICMCCSVPYFYFFLSIALFTPLSLQQSFKVLSAMCDFFCGANVIANARKNHISLSCCQSHRPAVLHSCDYEKLRQIYKDISGFIKNHMAEDQKLPQVGRAEVNILNSNVLFYRADWFVVLASL